MLAIDRTSRRRSQVAQGLFGARRLRRERRAQLARARDRATIAIASAQGPSRVRGVVVEIRDAVGEGMAATHEWVGNRLTTDVGSFRVRDESGSLWIGPDAVAVDVVVPDASGQVTVRVGDVVELIGSVRRPGAGPYRSEAVLTSSVVQPALLTVDPRG